MFLRATTRKFIVSMTLLLVVLSIGGAWMFHALWPAYYFTHYPSIPVFFYLFGLFYIYMFEWCFRIDPRRVIAVCLVAKVTKLVLSMLILMVYALAIKQQMLSFIGTYLVFYLVFLVFETRFFYLFEIKHKRYRLKNKEI